MTDPNDDLERQLRDGLRRGPLPPAPDSLRQRLAGLPTEGTVGGASRFLSGLRLAGLATAAAVALVFVIVVRSLPGPPTSRGAGPGDSPLACCTASTMPSPSTAPTPAPTPTPLPPQSPQPPQLPGFTCASTTVLPATTSVVVQVSDVRVGTHAGYDRIVFQFAGSGRPQLTVAIANPPFVEDASGLPVAVAGTAFLTLKLYDASGYPTYTGPSSFAPNYPALTALVNNGDFEGYVSWVAGLSHQACYGISTLTNPTRIVVDIQTP
jgi:hypothetical protein